MKPLEANLFPLLVSPEALRVYRYGHKDPKKLQGYLRQEGFFAEIRGNEVWVYGAEAPEARAAFLGEHKPQGPKERVKAFNSYLNRFLAQKGFYRSNSFVCYLIAPP